MGERTQRRRELTVDDPRLGRVRFRLLSPKQLRSIRRTVGDDLVRRRFGGQAVDLERAREHLAFEEILRLALIEPPFADFEKVILAMRRELVDPQPDDSYEEAVVAAAEALADLAERVMKRSAAKAKF